MAGAFSATGKRVFEDGRWLPVTNHRDQVVQLRLRQRRRLDDQQHIVGASLHGLRRIDLFDLVLFFQLFNDQLLAGRLHRLHVEAAEQLHVGFDDTHAFAIILDDCGDGSHQFVLDGNALVKEGNHDTLQAAGEGGSQEQLFLANSTALWIVTRRAVMPY